MKRNVIVAACLIVLIGTTVQAQTVVASKGVTLHDALTDIVEQIGLARLDDSGLPLSETIPADISVARVNLPEIMGKLLPPQYRWEMLPDSTLKISAASARTASSATRGITPASTPTSIATADPSAPLDDCAIINCFGLTPELIRVSAAFERQNRLKDAAWANAMAYAAVRPVYYPTPGIGGVYGQYSPGQFLHLYPWMEGCADGRPPAYLEFQYGGRRGEKPLWRVAINGTVPGAVDQGDTLSQKLPICSDASVTVTVEKRGQPWRWSDQYSLRPWARTEVPIGEFVCDDTARVEKPAGYVCPK